MEGVGAALRELYASVAVAVVDKRNQAGKKGGWRRHDLNNLLVPIMRSIDLLQWHNLGGEREQRLMAGAMEAADTFRNELGAPGLRGRVGHVGVVRPAPAISRLESEPASPATGRSGTLGKFRFRENLEWCQLPMDDNNRTEPEQGAFPTKDRVRSPGRTVADMDALNYTCIHLRGAYWLTRTHVRKWLHG